MLGALAPLCRTITGREDEGWRGVVTEPVGAGGVRLVAVDPDHDVAETENLKLDKCRIVF